MADVLKGYRTYLQSKSTVTTHVAGRVYFQALPQDPTFPAIVLNLLQCESRRHLTDAAGLARAQLQVDVYADTHDTAYTAAEAVRLVTEHYTGAWGATTVRNAFVESSRDITEPPVDGSQLFVRIWSLDVIAWHTEATP